MKCDFCGTEYHYSELLAFPHKNVYALASAGFVPSGFTSMLRKFGSDENPKTYFGKIVSRYGMGDEWALCKTCRDEMQKYAQKLMGWR